MIPNLVSRELRDTLLDYIDTTFAFHDRTLADALDTFLRDPKKGMFKGPYLNIKLPFRKAEPDREIPLDVAPSFTPYQHQITAFDRLTSRDGHVPKPTLVTTGTGSGKTECFLYPILDHVYRKIGKPGIKAIILYPMNALAFDQAKRLANMIYTDIRLQGKVTAGMYVGGQGKDQRMGKENVISVKELLQENPPDILLTNYKMLDFLLLRPQDQALWKKNKPDTLRYLVLDELHTYDGVQGADVACLLRRLKAKLKAEDNTITPIGTSATLADNDEEAIEDLIEFADKIFNAKFSKDGVLTEIRLSAKEFFPEKPGNTTVPQPSAEMDIYLDDNIESYISRQTELWFGRSIEDELKVGKNLLDHSFTRTVFEALNNEILELHLLEEKLSEKDDSFKSFEVHDRDRIMNSFFAMLSYAKQKEGERNAPLVTVQFQLTSEKNGSISIRSSVIFVLFITFIKKSYGIEFDNPVNITKSFKLLKYSEFMLLICFILGGIIAVVRVRSAIGYAILLLTFRKLFIPGR